MNKFIIDSKDNLYIDCPDLSFKSRDSEELKELTLPYEPKIIDGKDSKFRLAFCTWDLRLDSKDNLYIASNDGLLYKPFNSTEITRLIPKTETDRVLAIGFDSEENLCIGSDNSVFYRPKNSNEFKKLISKEETDRVSRLRFDSEDNLYIACQKGLLFLPKNSTTPEQLISKEEIGHPGKFLINSRGDIYIRGEYNDFYKSHDQEKFAPVTFLHGKGVTLEVALDSKDNFYIWSGSAVFCKSPDSSKFTKTNLPTLYGIDQVPRSVMESLIKLDIKTEALSEFRNRFRNRGNYNLLLMYEHLIGKPDFKEIPHSRFGYVAESTVNGIRVQLYSDKYEVYKLTMAASNSGRTTSEIQIHEGGSLYQYNLSNKSKPMLKRLLKLNLNSYRIKKK
jgi:hypothetical protein